MLLIDVPLVGLEVLTVVPWEPTVGCLGDFRGVAQELGQIVERILPCQLAGVNKAREHISGLGAVLGFEKE